MMPPPNVTGSLHMGHALTFTLQDILIRFERMRGRDALWQPGTDHAGIATEIVVANQLAEQQIDKHDARPREIHRAGLGMEGESGGTITRQLRRLGASPDWARERFTMDPGLPAAVRRVFVDALSRRADLPRQAARQLGPGDAHGDLRSRGRQPRDARARSGTSAIRSTARPGRFIVVATTRPETMLGDTGVAVHPDDPRFADLVGKNGACCRWSVG